MNGSGAKTHLNRRRPERSRVNVAEETGAAKRRTFTRFPSVDVGVTPKLTRRVPRVLATGPRLAELRLRQRTDAGPPVTLRKLYDACPWAHGSGEGHEEGGP